MSVSTPMRTLALEPAVCSFAGGVAVAVAVAVGVGVAVAVAVGVGVTVAVAVGRYSIAGLWHA